MSRNIPKTIPICPKSQHSFPPSILRRLVPMNSSPMNNIKDQMMIEDRLVFASGRCEMLEV
jgi:hypothetical protein